MTVPTITLDSITLPGDLLWSDEYAWSPVAQQTTPTLTGALIVDESLRLAGRPVTLEGSEQFAWVTRATVDALRALDTPGRTMTLTLADGRTLTVAWRRDGGPCIEARPVMHMAPAAANDHYTITLRFMEV